MSVGKYFGEGFDGSPAPLAPAVENEVPGIAVATRILDVPRVLVRVDDKAFYEDRGMLAEASFFELFSFEFVAGDASTAFAASDNIVLTETLARKYFGESDAVGCTLEADGGRIVTVSAVLADLPTNSTFCFDFLGHLTMAGEQFAAMEESWGTFMGQTFVLLEPGADRAAIGARLTEIADAAGCPQVKDGVRFELSPLSRWHLDEKNNFREYSVIGSSTLVLGFSAVAVFVLLVAAINFVNLTTARSSLRAPEVGMRKTVGAARGQLVRQFLGESVLTAAIAFGLALLLVELGLPWVRELSGRPLVVPYGDALFLIECLAVVLAVGLLAGLYPALHLSRFRPVQILRGGSVSGRGRFTLRRILVVIQFALSTALLVCTGAIYSQLDFVQHMELGFTRENVIHIPIKGQIGSQLEAVKEDLLRSPRVRSVAAQYNLEANVDFMTNGFRRPDVAEDFEIQFNTSYVDHDYFATVGMEILEGRTFSRDIASDIDEAFVLSREAVRVMGFDGPVAGTAFEAYGNAGLQKEGTIIGVVNDAYLKPLRETLTPRIYQMVDDFSGATDYGVVLIRIDGGDVPGAVGHVAEVWERFNSGTPFEYAFLDDTYARLYERESRIGSILTVFTVLIVFISCLGLLGLASFSAQRRTKEIGVRKVLGASVADVVRLLAVESTVLVLAANVIAWPLAYYVVKRLLEYYAYRIDIGLGLFAGPALAVLAAALITVSYQAARAALTNPVEALRYE